MEMPFNYAKDVYGGTEYMAKTWERLVLPHMQNLDNYQCMIAPGLTPKMPQIIEDGRGINLWLHNLKIQFNQAYVEEVIGQSAFVERIKYIVVPSMFHKINTANELNVPLDKIKVIPNAIFPLPFKPEKFDNPKQIRIINTSTSYRGLPILMNALRHIEYDFRLEVYNDYYPDIHYQGDLAEIDKRVRFYGKTPRMTVMEAVENSHIFAYPCTYLETFCLSLAESMSAGNLCVYPDFGALAEVGDNNGIVYEHEDDLNEHEMIFAAALTMGIEKVRNGEWNPEETIRHVNESFSWENITQQWIDFDSKLKEEHDSQE